MGYLRLNKTWASRKRQPGRARSRSWGWADTGIIPVHYQIPDAPDTKYQEEQEQAIPYAIMYSRQQLSLSLP
jgi:hypothetical protein